MSFFGKAKIIVCLPNKSFNEENLGDIEAGVLFLLEIDLQMTSFRSQVAPCASSIGRKETVVGDCYMVF